MLQFLLVAWVSLLLACVYPMARDVEHIYQVFLRALLFVTPIFYTASILGDGAATYLVLLNPLAQLLELSRGVLIGGHAPTALEVGTVASLNGGLIWISWRLCKSAEKRLPEYV